MQPGHWPRNALDLLPAPTRCPWRRGLLALVMALLVATGNGDAVATASLTTQRAAFLQAEQNLRAGQNPDLSGLRDYPLYPYLHYQALTRRLPQWPTAEVRAFLHEYADSPLATRLRQAWLRQLAAARRWQDYLRDFQPTHNAELDCWRRQALLAEGKVNAALDDFAERWTQGVNLPTACDPVIAAWAARGEPSPERRWQRFSRAMIRSQFALARYLRQDMPPADQAIADAWLQIVAQPPALLDPKLLDLHSPRAATVISDGLERWSRRSALEAMTALDQIKQRAPQLAPVLAARERQLALWLASDYHPSALARLTALPAAVSDGEVAEWRVRVCLYHQDWNAAQHWLAQLPTPERDSPRWRYWQARVLERAGQADAARTLYRSIAGQRDYYGFLAADRLAVPYALNEAPLTVSATALAALLEQTPGLRRAREWYVIGREAEAGAEWRAALRGLNQTQLQHAARLASQWDWPSQALVTVAQAQAWDVLELRFPFHYREAVTQHATASAVDPAWVYAVIRQESGFRAHARSPVGALGLMQLMPATGRQIAQELGDNLNSPNPALLEPSRNIRYGTHYLRQMLNRLQDNPVLATAAYNAGPAKATQWLPSVATPAELWIETIPYRETRAYVQRVLEYRAIYQRRLGGSGPEPTLSDWMKPVLPLPVTSPPSGSAALSVSVSVSAP